MPPLSISDFGACLGASAGLVVEERETKIEIEDQRFRRVRLRKVHLGAADRFDKAGTIHLPSAETAS